MNSKNPDPISSIHSETGAGWEIVARHKYREELPGRIEALEANDSSELWDDAERATLESFCHGRAIQLQCANGYETLFLWRLGASDVVGVDISSEMIAQAREMTGIIDAPAQWHCTDVLKTPSELDGTADLVYTGGGALPWIMDIEAWARVVARLLRPGGMLYLNEHHPICFLWDVDAEDYRLSPGVSYGADHLIRDRGYPSTRVAMHAEADSRPVMREHIWPLGNVINALISAGLTIKLFNEINDPGWPSFPNMPKETLHRLPHRYVLHAEKPAHKNSLQER